MLSKTEDHFKDFAESNLKRFATKIQKFLNLNFFKNKIIHL